MTGKHTRDHKALTMDDAVWLINQAGWDGEDNTRIIGLAYSLSKMTIIDDMEDFDNYTIMKRVEFYEFIGRLAELLFDSKNEDIPLVKKLARLLTILIEKYTKQKFIMPNLEKDLDTESDDEDELVE